MMRCIRHDWAYKYPNCDKCVRQGAIICEVIPREPAPRRPTVVAQTARREPQRELIEAAAMR